MQKLPFNRSKKVGKSLLSVVLTLAFSAFIIPAGDAQAQYSYGYYGDGISITINDNADITHSLDVVLTLEYDSWGEPDEMRFANTSGSCPDSDSSRWSEWESYSSSKNWTLSFGESGVRKVCVEIKDGGSKDKDYDTINYVYSVQNPALDQSCGLDIALVMDSSGSIDRGELRQMKDAFIGFVDVFLPDTPTQFSVVDFDTSATLLRNFTGDQSLIESAINTPTSRGATNWEAGLLEAQGSFDPRPNPNLVVFASDGEPNKYGDNQGPGNGLDPAALNAAIEVANGIKASGTRIITLGIGGGGGPFFWGGYDEINSDSLIAISSQDAYYEVDGFDDLAQTLSNLASQLCGGTITARKVIDQDGNIQTVDDQTPGADWNFQVAGVQKTTDQQGYTDPLEVKSENEPFTVSETQQEGYSLISASCQGSSENNGVLSGNTISGIAVSNNDVVSCTFYNSLVPECTPGQTEQCNTGQPGVCEAGTKTCGQNGFWGECLQNTPASSEICDALDNDCDGQVDEGELWSNKGQQCSVGVGICQAQGTFVCDAQNPSGPTVCSAVAGQPQEEVCNNLDDDCDGLVDEDLTRQTFCGLGVCSGNTGFETCTAGVWGDNTCDPFEGASDEVCDGLLDEDCDGTVDEGCDCINGQTQSCGESDQGECSFGTKTCVDGVWGECLGAVNPVAEICDALDNDCDGQVDEGELWSNKGQQCSVGVGICQAQGTFVCDAQNPSGPTVCSAVAGEPQQEVCDNGLDDDCDGLVDLDDPDCDLGPLTIRAEKIVCQSEADLPNWGDDSGPSAIDEGTASDYLADNPSCSLASDWSFQWGYHGQVSSPQGTDLGSGGAGWHDFLYPTGDSSPAVAEISDLQGVSTVWVKENLKEGYIPFAGPAQNQNNVSAEMYCHTDIYNFDNYDRIDGAQLEQTYYCLAFNAPEFVPECEPGQTEDCSVDALGLCAFGTRTCTQQGIWGECQQTYQPVAEICDNGLDDDCDGYVDEQDSDCQPAPECIYPATTTCSVAGQQGICAAGIMPCTEEGFWGECQQVNFPSIEICDDGIDNDCDGTVDTDCCGNGTLDDGEECDRGSENGQTCSPPCSSSCKYCSSDCQLIVKKGPACGGGGVINPPPVTYTDLCPNMDGVQEEIPQGYRLQDGDCVPFQCSDGEDNDGDGLVDMEDPGCDSPQDDDESGIFQCSDGEDNDGDGLVDMEDPGCDSPQDNDESGEVLGETCGIYLEDFIKLGADNDPEEVEKLQTFLNDHMGENLEVTGVYDTETYEAVKRFQVEYWEQVLQPWVPHGLPTAKTPTGYVYKTTKRWINMIMCPELGIGMPDLSSQGEVLGETCGIYLEDFIKLGADNDPEEVEKLQTFLNDHMGENLEVTGVYDTETYEAVKRFQVEYWEQVLQPWVPHGLPTAKTPTGYVYKTTKRWINILMCSLLEIPMPDLP